MAGKTLKTVAHQAPTPDSRGQELHDQVLAEAGIKKGEKPLPEGHVQFELPSGSVVEMGPPNRGVMILISQITREEPTNAMLFSLVKALMYIRAIDGQKVELPQNMVDVASLCNRLGPDGEDTIIMAHMTYWPSIGPNELKVVKKNL